MADLEDMIIGKGPAKPEIQDIDGSSNNNPSLEERALIDRHKEQESLLEQKLDQSKSIFGKAFDLAKWAGLLAGITLTLGPMAALGTQIVSAGFIIGGYKEAKNTKKKYTWRRFARELLTGTTVGVLDYAIFSLPELLMKLNPSYFGAAKLTNRIVKTLLFNPIMIMPYHLINQGITYFRDHVGYGKAFAGLFNGKIKDYFRDFYQYKVKREYWKGIRNTFAFMYPLHYIQMNHHPNTVTRLLQSLFINGPLYRLILGGKKKAKSSKDYLSKSNDFSSQQPNLYGQNVLQPSITGTY